MHRLLAVTSLVACLAVPAAAQQRPSEPRVFTHADTLHGSNTAERAWWDAEFYDLHVTVHPADSSIAATPYLAKKLSPKCIRRSAA